MKKQVIIIHGGTTFDTYKDYFEYLKDKEITIEDLKRGGGWKSSVSNKLGEGFEVFCPQMPNKINAQYKEWKIYFDKIISIIDDNVIFIGHSLGGVFIAKYLSENKISKRIKKTILVAAPFDDVKMNESLASFRLSKPLKMFEQQGGSIYLIHSKDDLVVPLEQVEKYKKALPSAKVNTFNNKGHFIQEEFVEIIELIKNK